MQDELADAAIATLQQVTGEEDEFTAVDTALATLRDVTRDMQDKDGHWAMYLIAFAAGSRMRCELLGEPEDMTVAELANDRYRGEFAFLSACKTAVGGVQTPDEAITLAAALQYTGWRHVIGTLWTVWDQSARHRHRRLRPHGRQR